LNFDSTVKHSGHINLLQRISGHETKFIAREQSLSWLMGETLSGGSFHDGSGSPTSARAKLSWCIFSAPKGKESFYSHSNLKSQVF
jgi:hypothetical protein